MRWCLALAAACYSPAQLTGSSGDGGIDVPPGEMLCADHFGLSGVCASSTDHDKLIGQNINTDASCDPGVASVCLFHGTNVELTGDLRATGSRPLVVIAMNEISLDHGIVVDTSEAGLPSTDTARCNTGATLPSAGNGGAGGTGSQPGGHGGLGLVSPDEGLPSTVTSAPTTLESGCPGQAPPGGESARGGGAVYLLAGTRIDIEGTLITGGQGGFGALPSAGAVGGGAGGLIALEAPEITATAVLAPGGGGGGGAAGSNAGSQGGAGSANGFAGQGAGSSQDNNGGLGAYVNSPATDGGAGLLVTETGGGGGGGAGWILCSVTPQPGGLQAPDCASL